MELTQEPLWHDAGCQRSALDGHVFGGAHVPAVERLNELEVAAVLARLRRPLPVAAAFTFWIADQHLRTKTTGSEIGIPTEQSRWESC